MAAGRATVEQGQNGNQETGQQENSEETENGSEKKGNVARETGNWTVRKQETGQQGNRKRGTEETATVESSRSAETGRQCDRTVCQLDRHFVMSPVRGAVEKWVDRAAGRQTPWRQGDTATVG